MKNTQRLKNISGIYQNYIIYMYTLQMLLRCYNCHLLIILFHRCDVNNYGEIKYIHQICGYTFALYIVFTISGRNC